MGNNQTVITLVCLKMVNIIDVVEFLFLLPHKKASTLQLSAMRLCSEKIVKKQTASIRLFRKEQLKFSFIYRQCKNVIT